MQIKIINSGHHIIYPSFDSMWHQELSKIEIAGRVCYKSEEKITFNSYSEFIINLIKRGHESVLEHASMTVRFICDRGVSHELVRHRLAAYSQESTRYCNYKNKDKIEFIRPLFFDESDISYSIWRDACKHAAIAYEKLIVCGRSPQEARSVLPNSLKTEIVMTANMREWRHVLKLRTSAAAHPQMRQLMIPLLKELHSVATPLFDDIHVQGV